MRLYEVRVTRSVETDWIDLEIHASSMKEAKKKALRDAKENENVLFHDVGETSFNVEVLGSRR